MDQEAMQILRQSARRWNELRACRPGPIQMSGADFAHAQLPDRNLEGAIAEETNFEKADLMGAILKNARLGRSCFLGALLIGADLRGANLQKADLRGADMRGARLDGADMRGALFLSAPQISAASGNQGTRLPQTVARPDHWT